MLSQSWESNIVNLILRATAVSAPSAHYVALFSSNPGQTGTTGELSGGGYARVQHDSWTAYNTSTRRSTNNGDITFPVATGNWTQPTHFGVFDASTGGTFLFGGTITNPRDILTDDQFVARSGQLIFEFTTP